MIGGYSILQTFRAGRVHLAVREQQRVVLKLCDPTRQEPEKYRLLEGGCVGLAGLLDVVEEGDQAYLVLEYIPNQAAPSRDVRQFQELLRLLAELNSVQPGGYPLTPNAFYEQCFFWTRRVLQAIEEHHIAGDLQVTANDRVLLERLVTQAQEYIRVARRAVCHGDPADFNLGIASSGIMKLFDLGLSGRDLWLKDVALRLGGSAMAYPPPDPMEWLRYYLEQIGRQISASDVAEFRLTRAICNLYFDEPSWRIVTTASEAQLARDGYYGWIERILTTIRASEEFRCHGQ